MNFSDKEESHLAEILMESYNMSKVNKKPLEMKEIRKTISDFWSEVKERKEIIWTSGKRMKGGKDRKKKKKETYGKKRERYGKDRYHKDKGACTYPRKESKKYL